jgi:hypothetical protein
LKNAKNAIEEIRRDVSSGELVSLYFNRRFTVDPVSLLPECLKKIEKSS